MKLAVFAYNFPHKKTQDFLLKLFLEGYCVQFVVACEPTELSIPTPVLRVKPRHINMFHPANMCRRLGIPYYNLPHNCEETIRLIRDNGIEIGIISGARILKKQVIQSLGKGIINFHPGLIPQVRGLDALKWAVYHNLPIGITAHFIDERVDAGRIILRREIPVYKDDTLVDLSLRLDETQVNSLPDALEAVEGRSITEFPVVSCEKRANPPMPNELEEELPERFRDRLSKL